MLNYKWFICLFKGHKLTITQDKDGGKMFKSACDRCNRLIVLTHRFEMPCDHKNIAQMTSLKISDADIQKIADIINSAVNNY